MHQQKRIYILIASVLTFIAGILHATIIAFEHVAPLPLETLFFLGGGIAQVVLAILVMKTTRLKFILPLFVVNGGIASVWVLTRLFRAPFMDTPEGVGLLGVSVFLLEVFAILLLAIWKWEQRKRIRDVHGYSFGHVMTVVLIGAMLSGVGVYGGGMLGERIMPERTLTHGHAGDVDTHSDDEEPHVDKKDDHVDEVPHD